MKCNFYKLVLKMQKIKYGKNLKLYGCPVIANKKGSKIVIGENVVVKSSFLSNLIGLYQRSIIVARTENAVIEIGNNVGISGATIYARKSIKIGDNTLIGANTKIIDNDFHPIEVEARIKDDKDKIIAKEVLIGKNVFIGCNSIILKGTQIGDNSVVGAGAVVCGKFPPNSVICGNPAKVIRQIQQ